MAPSQFDTDLAALLKSLAERNCAMNAFLAASMANLKASAAEVAYIKKELQKLHENSIKRGKAIDRLAAELEELQQTWDEKTRQLEEKLEAMDQEYLKKNGVLPNLKGEGSGAAEEDVNKAKE